uniref:Chloramphenicol acetyltransferase-like domain-containing protein n=1 Tax=Tanacetum cinerariifolium TaxID=118510 RepID=A0A699H857_TANCI|nr:chloramphenicol acetyltransferase-like domain-containing protein [Tanacetum cinerariifolium]
MHLFHYKEQSILPNPKFDSIGKRVPGKNRCITVNLFHDGVFTVRPFEYVVSDVKQVTDIQFEGLEKTGHILGMRFHHPEQLKLCLVNYGVANGKKKDLGEDESLNVNKVTTRSRSKSGEGTSKSPKTPVKAITSGEGYFESPKWTKAKGLLEGVNELLPNAEHKKAILVQRTKPIITMLEDIRLYVMQRLVAMNRVARTWEHSITPSIIKRVEVLKEKQRTMLERPRKSRMKAQSENNYQVSSVGKKMTCTNYQETGHNKSSYKKQPVPKPPKVNRPLVPKPPEYGTYASARGRGSRGGRGGFGGRVKGLQLWVKAEGVREEDEGVRCKEMRYAVTRRPKFDFYQAQQDEFDQEGLRYTLKEEDRFKRQDEERLKEQLAEQDWERKMDYYHWNLTTIDANVQTPQSVAANISDKGELGFRLGDFEAKDNYKSNADLEIPSEKPIAAVTSSADKGKQLAEPSEQPELQPQAIKRGSKRKASASSEKAPAKERIIFHKNMGRSERIFYKKMKRSGFRQDGEGSTPNKAFSFI